MLIMLILIDVQYLQKVVFSFEKASIRQNHSSSGSLYLIKKCSLPVKFPILSPLHPLPLFGKPDVYENFLCPKINWEEVYYTIYLYLDFWKPQIVYPF